jgi:hypothetical protein
MAGALPFHIVVRESMVENCKKRNRGRIDKVTGRRTKEKKRISTYPLCPKIEDVLASREVNFLTLTNYI